MKPLRCPNTWLNYNWFGSSNYLPISRHYHIYFLQSHFIIPYNTNHKTENLKLKNQSDGSILYPQIQSLKSCKGCGRKFCWFVVKGVALYFDSRAFFGRISVSKGCLYSWDSSSSEGWFDWCFGWFSWWYDSLFLLPHITHIG